jgi:hypothetical protein
LHELLAGKDAMLGIYPSEHLRWASYIGILTGMDVPKKINSLLDKAKAEYQQHERLLEAKAKSKKDGLGFSLTNQTSGQRATQPQTPPEFEKNRLERLAETVEPQRVNVGKILPQTMNAIGFHKGEKLTLEELVTLLQNEADVDDERSAVAAVLELQIMGYLVEIKKNLFLIA